MAPAAEHAAILGEFGDLGHAVRDIENGEAPVAQPLEDAEHFSHIGGGQRRRRLVEDENLGVARERLGDLDHLPARQRQILDRCQGMHVLGAGPGQRVFRHAALPRPVDQAEAAGRGAQEQIVGHRQVRHQREFLEHADDAGRDRRRRVAEAHLAPVEHHPALIGLGDAAHDLDQRRLAGAVLAQYRMDAAARAGEPGPLQGPDAAVALVQILGPEQHRGGGRPGRSIAH